MAHDDLTDDLSWQLAAQLAGRDGSGAACAAGQSVDPYRVDEVLKRSASEVTEVVYFEGQAGGELGPFVRKRFVDASVAGGSDAAGTTAPGAAYDVLYRAQRSGRRFAHLPRVIDIRASKGKVSVVTEYVPGETLAAHVARRGGSARLALQVMPVVCDAVRELHEGFGAPIIHRDLKPSNIMVADADIDSDAAPAVTIIDFGIARCWKPGAQGDTTHFGTRSYAPPEQFGFGQTDVRSDVYALGMLLFFCCTGLEPRPGLDAEVLAIAGVPDELAGIILHATAFDPAGRYASAAEMGRALRSVCAAGALTGEGTYAGVSPFAASAAGGHVRRPWNDRRSEGAASDASAAPSTAPVADVAARRVGNGGRSKDAIPDTPDPLADLTAARAGVGPVGGAVNDAHPEITAPNVLAALSASGSKPADSGPSASSVADPAPDPPAAPTTMAIVPYSQRPRLPQIPRAIGILWNVLLLGFASLIVAGCWYAILRPNAHDAGEMLWFRILEYGVTVAIPVVGASFFLSDRRRLMSRVPVLRDIPAGQGLAACICFGTAAFLVTAVIGGVLGYF